eukprot:1186904-Prorocentrum_minimum.AAC.2
MRLSTVVLVSEAHGTHDAVIFNICKWGSTGTFAEGAHLEVHVQIGHQPKPHQPAPSLIMSTQGHKSAHPIREEYYAIHSLLILL